MSIIRTWRGVQATEPASTAAFRTFCGIQPRVSIPPGLEREAGRSLAPKRRVAACPPASRTSGALPVAPHDAITLVRRAAHHLLTRRQPGDFRHRFRRYAPSTPPPPTPTTQRHSPAFPRLRAVVFGPTPNQSWATRRGPGRFYTPCALGVGAAHASLQGHAHVGLGRRAQAWISSTSMSQSS